MILLKSNQSESSLVLIAITIVITIYCIRSIIPVSLEIAFAETATLHNKISRIMLPIKIATIITQLLFHKSIMPLKYKITPFD